MNSSPLTQQTRPATFQPKVVQLYQTLFLDPNFVPSEGFWRELFLLSPDTNALTQILDSLSPDDILQAQALTRDYFLRSLEEIASGESPSNLHALEVLSTFLSTVLTKRYTNPSSDVITILAGLDKADGILSDFVSILERISSHNSSSISLRKMAIEVQLAMTSGGYMTSVISYYMQKDIFTSIVKVIAEGSPNEAFQPLLLLSLLASYSKFEFQNPYQAHLGKLTDENALKTITQGLGETCAALRNSYVEIQEDLPEGWNVGSTLGFIGLGVLVPGRRKSNEAPKSPEETRELFGSLPSPEAAILLSLYNLINTNKTFSHSFFSFLPEKRTDEPPCSAFLSMTSYLLQHAFRSPRVANYAELCLYSLRIVVEDPHLCKKLCEEKSKLPVRLCRQRAPYLPYVQKDRVLATVIIDIAADAISHNLRRSLDMDLYYHVLTVLYRLLTYMFLNKVRLLYHWSELWRTLLSFVRFLTTYPSDLVQNPKIHRLVSSVTDLLTFCIACGDSFLPTPDAYDDLFYKIVENGPTLQKFKNIYKPTSNSRISPTYPIDTLLSVTSHFHSLLLEPDEIVVKATDSNKNGSPATSAPPQRKQLSSKEVHEIIQKGYDTLSIQMEESLIAWDNWREADWRTELKMKARYAVNDTKVLVAKTKRQVPPMSPVMET